MKLCFLIVLAFGYASGNLVSSVVVVDFPLYIQDVITATAKRLEQKSWCNLKVPDADFDIDELVMGWHAKGKIHYKNGFVHSIQAVDIRQDTVQGRVALNSDQLAQAIITGTLRMHDVAVGYDVQAVLEDGTHTYTASYVYPLISFAFTINKVIDHDEIAVTVISSVTNNQNLPDFRPKTRESDVFTTLFDRTMSVEGINAWGPDVVKPIADEVVKQITFPTICYNC